MDYVFKFIVGSQFLYGEEILKQVEANSKVIINELNNSGRLPWKVVFGGIVKTEKGARDYIKEANYDDSCAGIITFCHTFSPSKMWINALSLLQKPWLHFHTQFNEEIPNDAIDMNYMNLHQSAHGDKEHGFIGARMGVPRKIVVGYWKNADVQRQIARWMRACIGVAVSRNMKVMRFGDNMREVAVTEGDKTEAQIKLGWQVNTWPVGLLVEGINDVIDTELDEKMKEYREKYSFFTEDIDAVRYQAKMEIAMKKLLDSEECIAFNNTFEDLYGMEQLSGLASQNLMAQGYGYGGEGDWKVSAMTAIIKVMTKGMDGGTSFMEDYTYDLKSGLTLGSHMLEICPSLAIDKPRIEVHHLGIGGKNPPARLVFEGKAGAAIVVSLVDMGGRMRLIVQDIECVRPTKDMPNLPVARVMWKAMPNLEAAAYCWILAGGSHHTVLSYDCDVEMMRDFARIMEIEFVYIGKDTDPAKLEQDLLLADLAWKLKG